MRDCPNAAMRDRLPDLLHGRATDPALAEARTHVARCEACARELALLRDVRAASPSPGVNAARIVAALPAYRRPSRWTRISRSPQLRVAAAVLVVAGGIAIGYDRDDRIAGDTVVALAPTPRPEELAIGENLSDLSDSDLRGLAREIAEIEAVTSAETDVVDVPSVGQGGA
ncbi:MAG: hypothetical protein WD801_01765 [Gemmatimonadaceae bacterium]